MKLALFFTCKMSLAKWAQIGSLSREIKPYQMLANKFDQIYFFTYGSKKDQEFAKELGEKIIVLPNKWKIPFCFYGFLMPFFYWKFFKQVDILKTNQMAGAIPAVIARVVFKKKLIVRNGYEWLNVLIKEKKPWWKRTIVFIWEKIAYKAADIVVFTSQKDKDFAQKKFNIPERKIRLAPNGVDTGLFKPLGTEKQKGRVVYVGRLAKEKNLFNLIEAAAGLPIELIFIGQGDLKNALERSAKQHNVKAQFLGPIPNEQLPQELNKAEAFILPSQYEGSPKALLEAMACGLACIATDVEGIQEVISHKQNGYLCQTDSSSIRQALKEVLGNSGLMAQMGKNGRETILKHFNFETLSQGEIALFPDLKVLILAGGRGMRLWPLSTQEKPKQFQKLASTKTMLQETVWRLAPDIPWSDIFVATNIQHFQEVALELPKLPKENIIAEPASRERVASTLLFLASLPKEFLGKPILVLPSDHLIKDVEAFKKAVLAGEEFIKENPDYIFALSGVPNFPDTGLGYIQKGEKEIGKPGSRIYQVAGFVEKPNLQRASEFLSQGNYFWNTAIYMFTPELVLSLIKKFVPDNYQRFLAIQKAAGKNDFKQVLEDEYKKMDQTSLEYSILENYDKIAVLGVDMGWSDVGSWSVLKDCLDKGGQSFAQGNHIDMDSQNVMVYGLSDKLVATVGLKDIVIVLTDDIVLVCNKNESQKVKQLAQKLEAEKKYKYL